MNYSKKDKLSSSVDEGDPTPINGTGAYPIFREAAREVSIKLDALGTPEAKMMAGEMRWFQETFASWSPTNRPNEADRKRLVADFLDTNSKAMSYILKIKK
jgi:hypothetical protein